MSNSRFRNEFESNNIIKIEDMRKEEKKKKGGKAEFESAIKGNEAIRNMKFHMLTFEELEELFGTNISDSKSFTFPL